MAPASLSHTRHLGVHRNAMAVFAAVIMLLHTSVASAQDFLEKTILLEVTAGSSRSEIIRNFAVGGYELDEGEPVDFSDWYSPRFPDLNFIFLTELNPDTGLIWGFSLGERGQKYSIDPGIWLGFIHRAALGSGRSVSISVTTMIGGTLREKSCFGFYATVGEELEVNCRLAATDMPVAETLTFLAQEQGYRDTRLSLRYEIQF